MYYFKMKNTFYMQEPSTIIYLEFVKVETV